MVYLTLLVICSLFYYGSYGQTRISAEFERCSLQCGNGNTDADWSTSTAAASSNKQEFLRGKSGPKGEQGEVGAKGEPGADFDLELITQLQRRFTKLKKEMSSFQKSLKPMNCMEIKESNPTASSGVYKVYENIQDVEGNSINCDMSTDQPIEIPILASCEELHEQYSSLLDGVYRTAPHPSYEVNVSCDLQDGGWTIFQRRFDGSVDFTRNFYQYSKGFGNLDGEFWLGLDHIYNLTKSGNWKLRVEIESYDGETAYAEYASFSVGPSPGFVLSVGTYSGTAGDSMTYHNGQKFSTFDYDQDSHDTHCAQAYGSWWHNRCHYSNLNSPIYINDPSITSRGLVWHGWKGTYNPQLKKTVMKIKPQ